MASWHTFLRAGTVAFVVLSTMSARGQTVVRYTEGPGVRLAQGLVLHPGVGLETSVDSNVFFNAPEERPISAPLLNAIFHLDLATLSPQRRDEATASGPEQQIVDFRLRFAGAYRAYFSDNQAVTAQDNTALDGALDAVFNPRGPVRLRLFDNYVRSITATNLAQANSFIVDYNQAGAGLVFAPGGEMLQVGAGYSYNFHYYENSFATHINPNLYYHQFNLDASWKFLPKTALTFNATQGVYHRDLQIEGASHPRSYPLRLSVGVVGQFTYRLQGVARVGYGNGFYSDVPHRSVGSYNNVIGTLQLKILVSATATAAVGYERSFFDALFGDVYNDDHVYVRYDHMLFGRLILRLDGGYRYRQYHGIDPAIWGISTRGDNIFELHTAVDFRVRDWLFAGVGYDLISNQTDARPVYQSIADNPSYTKHLVFFKIDVSY
jgi:hypothetical protein